MLVRDAPTTTSRGPTATVTTVVALSLLSVVFLTGLLWHLYAQERAIRSEHRHLTTGRYDVGKHVRPGRRDLKRRARG